LSNNRSPESHIKPNIMQKPSHYISRSLSAVTLLAVGVLSAQAHPGHSLLDATPNHVVTSPDHITVLVLSGLTILFGARLVQRRLPRRLLQIAAVIALGSAAAIWATTNI
jgi:hypothetical protein